MIKHRIPALLLALSPIWVSASVYANDVKSVDPVASIDTKLTTKQSDIDAISSDYDTEAAKLQKLKNEQATLEREGEELVAKQKRAKSALDKQYSHLLDDPETDLVSFQKNYQEAWAAVKQNQTDQLNKKQEITESEMELAQLKQKRARLKTEYANLQESRIEARVKRLETELRQTSAIETSYKTTCSTTMTLGECASQGRHLTKQKAVKTFREQLLNGLTESSIAQQNVNGVELNITVQETQILRSGFEGSSDYYTQMKAQLQAKPEPVAACKLLNVSARYCLQGSNTKQKRTDKTWATVTVRSDQYNDAVTINGINYGSTPVEIVLPTGRHQVTVAKEGYETYNRVITINGNDTVWVKLRPNKED
ncbi:PEGA domain-containing protein [Vibrio sp. CAIM 722]|uniref:PEGA domain-containing protein n=1 Tax=Vibrio eleionomae TaxID=2653505 RepID=A0A7X4LNL5_9VIBR|nr:PEGA domain-containing protein [Vibrio eleionomae]MZI95267.1 PEGA domain-containing protein [Vibrio eleionomae]